MEMCLCGTLMPGELPKGIAAAVPQEKHLQEIFYVEGKKKLFMAFSPKGNSCNLSLTGK